MQSVLVVLWTVLYALFVLQTVLSMLYLYCIEYVLFVLWTVLSVFYL